LDPKKVKKEGQKEEGQKGLATLKFKEVIFKKGLWKIAGVKSHIRTIRLG